MGAFGKRLGVQTNLGLMSGSALEALKKENKLRSKSERAQKDVMNRPKCLVHPNVFPSTAIFICSGIVSMCRC